MAEYIEREEALKGLEYSEIGFYDDEPIQTRNSALKIIQNIPAADVAPVKHGKWLKRDDMPRIVECKCSVCGYADYQSKNDRYWFERNYCPNCGAKMNGGQDDA